MQGINQTTQTYLLVLSDADFSTYTGIILCVRPANERQRYKISSLIAGRMHKMIPTYSTLPRTNSMDCKI